MATSVQGCSIGAQRLPEQMCAKGGRAALSGGLMAVHHVVYPSRKIPGAYVVMTSPPTLATMPKPMNVYPSRK